MTMDQQTHKEKPTEAGPKLESHEGEMSRANSVTVSYQPPAPIGGTSVAVDLDAASRLANALARGDVGVPKAFRKNPGACNAVIVQAMGWGLSPVSTLQSAYLVGDQIGYEAKIFGALINLKAPLARRPRYSYTGEYKFTERTTKRGGKMRIPEGDRQCTIRVWLIGDDEPFEYTTPRIGDIEPKNSTLWGTDPDRQLAYYAMRAWARRDVPEVVFGLYTQDELMDAPELGPVKAGQAIDQLIEPKTTEPEPVEDIEDAELVEEQEVVEAAQEPQDEQKPEKGADTHEDPQDAPEEDGVHLSAQYEHQDQPEGDLSAEAEEQVDAAKRAFKRRLANCQTKAEVDNEMSWLEGTPGWLHFKEGEMRYAKTLANKRRDELPGGAS